MLIGDILRLSAQRHPAKTALICEGREMAYGALDAAANRFANAVLGLGLAKGESVAIMCPNIPEYCIVHFGTARTGCLLVNLSTMYGPDELSHILARTRARLLVVEQDSQDRIAAILDRLPGLEHIVVIGTPSGLAATRFEDFVAGRPDHPPRVALDETDPMAMTFTGGTTGLPKGALVSHRARCMSAYMVVMEHELTGADIVAAVTPLYHAVGLMVWVHGAILAGATCVLLRRWDPGAFVDLVARHGVTAVLTVPVQLRGVLSDAHFDAAKLASLRKVSGSGAPVSAELIAEARAKLPNALVIDHYGQSETGPLTFLKHWHPPEKFGTIGLPAIGVDLAVVDPDGNPVAPGEVGEIKVAGEFMFEGYFEDPVETATYFRSGDRWGWTGDLATVDADGFITLAGRSKDMIVSGGINVYPREVEIVLDDHGAVAECTVFGIPDEEWGEALVAYVVKADGADVTAEALVEYCGSRVARFKRPKVVVFVEAIPKTPTGKIQKQLLRAAFLRQHGAG